MVRGRGKRGRVRRQFDSPTFLGSRWGEAAGRRDRAAAALGYSGGGVRGLGERRHGVAKLAEELGGGSVVRRSGAGALYRRERRLGFGGTRRRPATELMAVGLARRCAAVNGGRARTAR